MHEQYRDLGSISKIPDSMKTHEVQNLLIQSCFFFWGGGGETDISERFCEWVELAFK